MQSKYVTKHSRADTSHVISTWPIRESQLSIQSDWLRSVHVTNGVRDHDADAELQQNKHTVGASSRRLKAALSHWEQQWRGRGSTYREYMNPRSWRRPFWSTQTTPGITWLTAVFQAIFALMGPTLFSLFVKTTLEWGFGHQPLFLLVD